MALDLLLPGIMQRKTITNNTLHLMGLAKAIRSLLSEVAGASNLTSVPANDAQLSQIFPPTIFYLHKYSTVIQN